MHANTEVIAALNNMKFDSEVKRCGVFIIANRLPFPCASGHNGRC